MENEKKVLELNLDDILPNRFQPRIKFSEDAINELAESIKEHGVIQPIIVRQIGDRYEIIAGERRYKASVLAGKTTIPAIIANLNDRESAEIALIENVQREDLSPIEEAISYRKILDMGLTQEELAGKLDRNQSTIANKLRLLNLEEDVQEALLNNEISERHARSLLRLLDKKTQIDMLNKVINERLTVRKTDEEIDKLLNKNDADNTSYEDNGVGRIWLSNNDKKGEIVDKNDNMNFNIPSEPIIEDIKEKPLGLFNNTDEPIPETIEFNDLDDSINSGINENFFGNFSSQHVNNETSINNENPGFLDIDKIETEAKDINIDKPLSNISDLLQSNDLGLINVNEPIIEENKFKNNEESFWSNKFFNIDNVESESNEAIEGNPEIFGEVGLDNNIHVNQPTIEESASANSEPIIEENNNNHSEDLFIETNDNETNLENEEGLNPAFDLNNINLEPAKVEFDNIINNDNIDEDEINLPIQSEKIKEPAGADLKAVINTIRECTRTIERMGYVVDTEELDFENEYRVTIKIEK